MPLHSAPLEAAHADQFVIARTCVCDHALWTAQRLDFIHIPVKLEGRETQLSQHTQLLERS